MTNSLWRKRQEPDQYAKGYADAMNWKTANHLEHLPVAQPAQEPVAKYSDIVSDGGLDSRNTTPPQRKPLTDEDYVNACMSYRHDFGLMTQEQRDKLMFQAREWARAFGMNESAHGIKE